MWSLRLYARGVKMASLSTLPVIIHEQSTARLSQTELTHFETMLATADDTLDACMAARRAPAFPDKEESTRAVLQAVVDTVAALTGASPPLTLTPKTTVAWVSKAMLEMRDRSVAAGPLGCESATVNLSTVSACMELISNLNAAIGGARRHV